MSKVKFNIPETEKELIDSFKSPLDRWLSIKNTEEMRTYIRNTIPEMIYNDEFLESLVRLEFYKLVQYKKDLIEKTKNINVTPLLKSDSKSENLDTLESKSVAKDILYSA